MEVVNHLPADKAVVVGVLEAADRLRRYLGQLLEPHGLTLQQFNVLRILRGAGEGGLPTLEIGARMIEKTPGVTRLIDRLEAKGLVERVRCREDRRQVLCALTPAGDELLAALDRPIVEADRVTVGRLERAEQRRLAELLAAVCPQSLS